LSEISRLGAVSLGTRATENKRNAGGHQRGGVVNSRGGMSLTIPRNPLALIVMSLHPLNLMIPRSQRTRLK
jgi:hypothetical protein